MVLLVTETIDSVLTVAMTFVEVVVSDRVLVMVTGCRLPLYPENDRPAPATTVTIASMISRVPVFAKEHLECVTAESDYSACGSSGTMRKPKTFRTVV